MKNKDEALTALNELNIVLETYYNKTKRYSDDLEVLEIIKKRKIDVEDIINATNYFELYRAYCRGEVFANEYMCSAKAFKEFKLLSEWLEK